MMKVTLDHISCRDGVPILRPGAGTRAAMELSIHNRGLFLGCCLAVEVRILTFCVVEQYYVMSMSYVCKEYCGRLWGWCCSH